MNKFLRFSVPCLMILGAALAISMGCLAYEFTDIRITSPGELAECYESLYKAKPEALRISGRLNSADIIALRRLCGSDRNLNPTDGTVRKLDLTNVSFVPDRKGFVWFNNMQDSARITSENALPALFMYQCNVDEILLPSQLDTIYPWALAMMPLKELYIPDGVKMRNKYVLYGDSLLTKIRLPFTTELYQFSEDKVKGLREVESGGFIFATGSAFMNIPEYDGVMPDIEKFTVNGPVGHIDATPFINNPRLKSITFNGPLYTTGTCLASSCDSLQSVTFNAPVGILGWKLPEKKYLPMLERYTFNAPVLFADYIEETLDSTEIKKWEGRDEFLRTYAEIIRKAAKAARNKEDSGTILLSALTTLRVFSDSLECIRILPEYDSLMAEAMTYDANKSKIQILKESAPYVSAGSDSLHWSYASPSDPLLSEMRIRFNLDSVAGNGDDYSKIKNLTYWVHEVMPHNGSRADMPESSFRLDNLIEYAQKDSAGGNCRILAIALNQALLAEGIPARYLTCQSKAYDTDNDCHVICTAWSKELGKWVWCDPTFAAFVTAPDGTPLHPGEVRQRLIDGEELCLNEDANWNHRTPQTKEDYLDNYMAKNLYLISAYSCSRPLTEGPDANEDNLEYITLKPEGFDMRWTQRATSDEGSFWEAPENY